MEVITLSQVEYGTFNGKANTMVIHVTLPEAGKGRKHWADVEKNETELKQAVVNKYLQQGYRAPQNEIAKYITKDGYYKEKHNGGNVYADYIPGPKLVMTRGK